MKNVTRMEVEICFPEGAHFYKNVNEMVYKKLLAFIYTLSCVSVDTKCKDCPLKEECRYYKFTGENFSQYAGIIIKNSLFTKSIFQKRESLLFEFFLIGQTRFLKEYIRLFFEQHLQQQLCSHFFYIKRIQEVVLEDEYEEVLSLKSFSKNEQNSLLEYRNMIQYFNDHYETDFLIPEESVLMNRKSKKINAPKVILKTSSISRNGYMTNCEYQNSVLVNKLFKQIGIGKSACIGGV